MRKQTRISVLAVAAVLIAGCATVASTARQEPIQPIEPAKVANPAMVELGKKLFFDTRLSRSGGISCNFCHNLSTGGSDNLAASIGDRWQKGGINSPTVLNATLNIAQFWDGRAKDLKEQAGGPIANPAEMASTHVAAVSTLQTIPGYVAEFKQVFGAEQITIDRVTQALAAFEETLVTPNARFDKWLKGDDNAITEQEQRGYILFRDSGCVACHNGVAIGGNSFQKMGLLQPYKTAHTAQGRIDVTKKDQDRFMFKVPTLRNVELTYPYFHDGAASTLAQAVDTMGKLQLGRTFTTQENTDIVAFLKTLTGDQPSFALPHLPPSSDKTPRPDPFAKRK
ncbi:MAG: cytochrome-c peroxidase [Burkholderiaceae bacterium]|jgi:cytochrome c peroxidase|nr:cytochrome-c peroxidase [Burkholderiaceae bacterium]